MTRFLRYSLIASLVLLSALPSSAWLSGWSYRVPVTVLATGVDENTNVVLLRLDQMPASFWTHVNSTDGRDIRVTTSDGDTQAPVHIIGFNHGSTVGLIRGGLSHSASVNTTFYVYYGNTGATMPAAGSTYGSQNAYGANVAAAWSFNGGALTDDTGKGYTLTANGSPATTTGPSGTGLTAYDFNGSTQYLFVNTSPVSDWPMTVEVFFNADNTTARAWVINTGNSTTSNHVGSIAVRGDLGGSPADPVEGYFRDRSSVNADAQTSTGYTSATWYHAAATRNGTTGTSYVYLNGSGAGSNSASLDTITPTRVGIGALYRNTTAFYFDGKVAYPIIHSVARSQNYLATNQRMIVSPGDVFSVGAEESLSSGNWSMILLSEE